MRKIVILSLLIISFSVFSDTTNQSNSASNQSEGQEIIHKLCLFHSRVYQVIPYGLGECSLELPGNGHQAHNEISDPTLPGCFSEIIRYRRRN